MFLLPPYYVDSKHSTRNRLQGSAKGNGILHKSHFQQGNNTNEEKGVRRASKHDVRSSSRQCPMSQPVLLRNLLQQTHRKTPETMAAYVFYVNIGR